MNAKEREYFNELIKSRSKAVEALAEPFAKNLWRSVVEKYSDQAHFVYELIQNADDAKATYVKFILENDRLIFVHDGERHFSITNPKREEQDRLRGELGDINAITGIAFSSKTMSEENKIGKFGVGFKAVFQYTATPEIYDSKFCFRLNNYIVPEEIDHDFEGRKRKETLFVFPFNLKSMSKKQAVDDIYGKLDSLVLPTLFLNHLERIEYSYKNNKGCYSKKIVDALDFDETKVEFIEVQKKINRKHECDKLYLFTRKLDDKLNYSVGYFVDKKNKLVPKSYPAFCYFPTKERTELNFIINGPFLLTDSREGIKAGEKHNKELIGKLAKLAGDAIVLLVDIGDAKGIRLIDDNIFDVIPYDEEKFDYMDGRNKISFHEFFNCIQWTFENERVIPSKTGYIYQIDAYFADQAQIIKLISENQLKDLTNNEDASWAFSSLITRINSEWSLRNYLDMFSSNSIDDYYIYCRCTNRWFLENQSYKWISKFHKYITDSNERINRYKYATIFLDNNKNACAAFDGSDNQLLFALEESTSYKTIHKELLNNDNTRLLIKLLGLKEPNRIDEVVNILIPKLKKDLNGLADDSFKKFFKCYCELSKTDCIKLINELKEFQWLLCNKVNGGEQKWYVTPCYAYFPNIISQEYLQECDGTNVVDFDYYLKLIEHKDEKNLYSFFVELGVNEKIAFYQRELDDSEMKDSWKFPRSTGRRIWREYYLDGALTLLTKICNQKNKRTSVLLWDELVKVIQREKIRDLDTRLSGQYCYYYRTSQWQYYETDFVKRLKNDTWIFTKDGQCLSPSEVDKENLCSEYTMGDAANVLIDFLGIKDSKRKFKEEHGLTDENVKAISMGEALLAKGFTEEQLQEMIQDYQNKQERNKIREENEKNKSVDSKRKQRERKVTEEILNYTNKKDKGNDDSINEDSDGYTTPSVDSSKIIERAMQKSKSEIDRIIYLDELQQLVNQNSRYSYGWFKALLALECENSSLNNESRKEVSISFGVVEKEEGTNRVLILKHPDRYIPQSIEDLADIPVTIYLDDNKSRILPIEVMNIKSYTVRVKLKPNVDISDIDFSKILEARIDVKNPVFLLEELRKQFNNLDLADDYDMRKNLCKNIEFIFGPPGTGKTTYLANDLLIPKINNEKAKILVLTPTNKAADVITNKIIEMMGKDKSYKKWLVRFGTTNDNELIVNDIYKDKYYDIDSLDKAIVVTTIARYPYDYYIKGFENVYLQDIKWDCIVFDEASMIPLANIVYPLYQNKPMNFYIAGDPFQIEPITSIGDWKNENIYTLVKLNSFIKPKTVPHDYKVKLLTTQYRSIPSIGNVFSSLTYGGVLNHHRNEDSQNKVSIPKMGFTALNTIKFPISKYESIYKAKKLNNRTPYHIYSALFTYEFICYISKKIAQKKKSKYTIGVIAPYRAQADLIERLVMSATLPSNIGVSVGTIHGFQGDECNIILAVLNTPPYISSSCDMFLNKLNIINVAISRARDYLFMVMPDDSTENIENLNVVNRVENLFKESNCYSQFNSNELEEIMFGNSNYLENNSFTTSHQSVNVYGIPEMKYEIRCEDNAIDVQIHEDISNKTK